MNSPQITSGANEKQGIASNRFIVSSATLFFQGATMKRLIVLGILIAASLVGSRLFAWGPAGHKIVASIAFRQLTPDEQQKIISLLKHHPRFEEKDFAGDMPDGVEENEWIFQQAAVWPDNIKKVGGDAQSTFSHPKWHFIDLPYFPTDEDRHALSAHLTLDTSTDLPSDEDEITNAVQAIRYGEHLLDNPHAPNSEKAKFLSWLFHLVGDVHQPLHSATLCMVDLFPGGDHGGNWIPTKQKKELHALWDGFPGSAGMKFRGVQQKAITLTHDHDLKLAGEKAANDLNVDTWVKESFDLAGRYAYTAEVLEHLDGETNYKKLEPLNLSEEYLSNGGEIADQRLVEAGYRLGAILKKLANGSQQ
jgi:hypothetical protein